MIDIRDKIEEAFDAVAEPEVSEETTIEEPEEVTEETNEEPESIEQEVEDSLEGGTAEDPEEEDAGTPEEEETPNYMELLQPDVLNQEERELFEQLPNRESKKLVNDLVARLKLSHQQSISRKMNQLNDDYNKAASEYRGLDNLKKEYQDYIDGDIVSVAQNALEWDSFAEEDPVAAIADLMQQYNVTVNDLYTGQVNPSQARLKPQKDSGYSSLEREVNELKQRESQRQLLQVQSQIDNDLDTFVNAKTESGERVYPLAEYASESMAQWVPYLRQQYPQATNLQILHTAYNNAIQSNPDLQALQKSQKTVSRAKKEATKKPAKKPTSLTPKGGKSKAKPAKVKKSIRQVAEDAYDNVND